MFTLEQQFADKARALIKAKSPALLDDLLAEKVILHTPRFWKPIEDRRHVIAVLQGILHILPDFEYHRVWYGEREVVMEFRGHVRGTTTAVHAVDIWELDEEGKVHTLTVMARPTSAHEALGIAEDALVRQMMAKGGN